MLKKLIKSASIAIIMMLMFVLVMPFLPIVWLLIIADATIECIKDVFEEN